LPDLNLAQWDKLYKGIEPVGNEEDETREGTQPLPVYPPVSEDSFVQIRGRYILTPVKSGLMIIDQKRANERILYETYIRSLTLIHQWRSFPFSPEKIDLDTANYMVLAEITDDLWAIGFDIPIRGLFFYHKRRGGN
jgi:DNA mismatch repair protein MutL